ncbi:MAG: bifunctional alpha,alpha-trehalose-phosphate synthase (UDP-forming)/trehalose-phosphatase, partial [Anaerolineae bacterium]
MPESESDKPSRRLLVVSNRLPVRVDRSEDGFSYEPVAGGLATSLDSVRQVEEMVWLGWPGVHVRSKDSRQEIEDHLATAYGSVPLFLPKAKFDRYYDGFSNGTIWPLFHYFPQNAHYDAAEWRAYRDINAEFGKRIVEIAEPGDRLWIHDYQLLLLPQMVREALPDIPIGFFLHIPFPSSELFRMLPWREEILQGLLGADLIGFHSFSYARHFLSSLLRLLGLEQEFGEILVGERRVRIDTFPLGVDLKRFTSGLKTPAVRAELEDLRKTTQGRKVVLTVDRLDFTKGIPRRLETFEHFLAAHPEWHDRVTLISLTVPSRTGVPEYQILKREVDELVGRINGRFGQPGWAPIWYLYRFLPFERLLALYQLADVALVTPLRDGMNLVAKEYLAARPDGTGVLVLSETAGAAEELGEALIVNPHNTEAMSDALLAALDMPIGEQKMRNEPMLARLRSYDVVHWAEDFLRHLDAAGESVDRRVQETLEGEWGARLRAAYQDAQRRLLLLDYDGTLVPFAPRPEDASPDPVLLKDLHALASDGKNTVVIVSGRDQATLESWVGSVGAALVAEHG